ncbi:MAG: hypothetical protein M3309_09800, partial [Actinomycetota bacterium]|nr:hypothetical protein [Actinomycetota bacterium]
MGKTSADPRTSTATRSPGSKPRPASGAREDRAPGVQPELDELVITVEFPTHDDRLSSGVRPKI